MTEKNTSFALFASYVDLFIIPVLFLVVIVGIVPFNRLFDGSRNQKDLCDDMVCNYSLRLNKKLVIITTI